MADIDSFTILADHSVLVETLGISKTSSQLNGMLYVANNNDLCKSESTARTDPHGHKGTYTNEAPCYVKPETTSRNLDYISLGTLLAAADISLDDVNYNGETYRETGATMILEINYDNFYDWSGVGDITYIYTPTVVAQSSWKFCK